MLLVFLGSVIIETTFSKPIGFADNSNNFGSDIWGGISSINTFHTFFYVKANK